MARLLAALVVLLAVPTLVAVGSVADEQPISVDEPSPRTVIADEQVRVTDEEATENQRRIAAESVEPVTVSDRDAQTAMVRDARGLFAAVRDVRDLDDGPLAGDDPPSPSEQVAQVEGELPEDVELSGSVLRELVTLSDGDFDAVERETLATVQLLARERLGEEDLSEAVDDVLDLELGLRPFPGDTAETIATPVVQAVARPTVQVDPDATAAERQRAAEAVGEVASVWSAGEIVVREGEPVEPMQLRAVEQLGQAGSSPLRALLRGVAAALLLVAVTGLYLSRMQPRVWRSGKKLVLLSGLVTLYAGLVTVTAVLTGVAGNAWAYAVPAGALAMLVALLIHPVVGIATMLPAVVLVLLVAPGSAGPALFAAATVLVSVPLTTTIAARSDLRSATLRAGLSFPVLAAVAVVMLGPREDLLAAVGAGALNGLVTALVVQGSLPFLENLFRLPTVTALLDLSDRNHPLLRELEAEALGSYNHSVMVASLTERACRAVGADPLLGTVAALYHDIGKVRQPHFFIENQQGIGNPHDELEPEVSAVIIQNHVKDGVEMATEHRLPPEVVACIGSHHGTMKVTYFYERALQTAEDPSEVDEDHFRYKGHKPRSREAAILLLADCCEATTRAMAMSRGTLPREEIEAIVDRLLQERVDDGQFDDCELTFRELRVARDTIVESLVGIYHPRIAYPPKRQGGVDGPSAASDARTEPARQVRT